MKNMKKLSGLIAWICVLLAVMLFATACDEAKTGDEVTTENTTASTEAPTTAAPTTGGTDDPVTPPDDGKVTYKVTILADVGVSVEGILVQMCDDSGCKLPAATNADGVVEFRYAPSNYHVTLSNLPAGYTAEAEYYFFNNELKILLKKAN